MSDEAKRAHGTWRPIETAPKDGKCLLWVETEDGGQVMVLSRNSRGHWLIDGEPTFCQTCYFEPTAWMPLPEGPDRAPATEALRDE